MSASPLFDQLFVELNGKGNWEIDPVSDQNECLTTNSEIDPGFDLFVDEMGQIYITTGGEEMYELNSKTLPKLLAEIQTHISEYTTYYNSLPPPTPI